MLCRSVPPPSGCSATRKRRITAFSLVEVSMAIAIAAFAFTALLGLIPTGLTVFRNAIDSSNETWIVQNLNSMIQVTDWSEVDSLDFGTSGEIYYYDEEGRLTDTERSNESDARTRERRLYGAKLLIEPLGQPGGDAASLKHGRRVIVVMANITQPPAVKAFEAITGPSDLGNIPQNVEVRTRCFLAAQMASDNP